MSPGPLEVVLCDLTWQGRLEFQLQHQSFQEYSGLISLKMDWFDLFVDQGTLRSPLQHQFEGINSLAHYLTTLCDHWEDHSLDCTDLCRQSNVCFSTHCLGLS